MANDATRGPVIALQCQPTHDRKPLALSLLHGQGGKSAGDARKGERLERHI